MNTMEMKYFPRPSGLSLVSTTLLWLDYINCIIRQVKWAFLSLLLFI